MAKVIDYTGQKFGKLTVIKRIEKEKKGVWWLCFCECGNTCEVSSQSLRAGTKSCGCLQKEVSSQTHIKDLAGQKFGRLKVTKRIPRDDKQTEHTVIYECLCECGKVITASASNLRRGNVRSCGCLQKEELIKRSTSHGKSHYAIYNIWKSMRARCYNKETKGYKYYGGRGITVCEEWLDFNNFKEWAYTNGYKYIDAKIGERLSIERIDVNGNYEPSNCTWIPLKEQPKNRRSGIMNKVDECIKLLTEIISDHYNENEENEDVETLVSAIDSLCNLTK